MVPASLLEQIASVENLWAAWSNVARKKSAPGIDGVRVEEFSSRLGFNLKSLRLTLRRGVYRPYPLRGVHIPKRNSGWREAGVPCVRDRVAQRAWLNIVGPLLDARFADSSHAYRPARSIHTAIAQLEKRRDKGCRFVLESDVAECFASIDRVWMLQTLRRHVAEPGVLRLVWRWMNAGIVWPGREREMSATGIAPGDLISPLLCNVFLDRFDADMLRGGFVPVRYADDFVIPVKKEAAARCAFDCARHALARLGLEMNADKTRITPFASGFEFVGSLFVNSLVLPLHRSEYFDARGRRCVRFSSGYEDAPRLTLPGTPRPEVLPPCGADAIATAQRNAKHALRNAPISLALDEALVRKRRRRQHKLLQEAKQSASKQPAFLI